MNLVNISDIWNKLDDLGLNNFFPAAARKEAVSCGLVSFDGYALDIFEKVTRQLNLSHVTIHEGSENQDIVIALFGDNEVSASSNASLYRLQTNNRLLVPLIIFSDAYFHSTDHTLGYAQHLSNLKKETDFPVLGLKESDLVAQPEILKDFLDACEQLGRLRNIDIVIRDLAINVSKKIDDYLPGAKLSSNHFQVQLYASLLQKLRSVEVLILQKREELIIENNNYIKSAIKDQADKIAAQVIKSRVKVKGSTIAVSELGLEFLVLADYIENFFDQLIDSGHLKVHVSKINRIRELLSFATDISLVGMFSSGKTTFINSLLGTELNTSSGHNTAVLTSIGYQEESNETPSFIEFLYKKKHHFELLRVDTKYSEAEFQVALKSPCNGQILGLFRENGQNILILADEDDGGKVRPVILQSRALKKEFMVDERTVKRKIVKAGELLTDGIAPQKHFERFRKTVTYNPNEIQSLINAIRNRAFSQLALTGYQIDGKVVEKNRAQEILDFLEEMLKGIKTEQVYVENHTGDSGKTISERYWQVDLYATLDTPHPLVSQIILDQLGWARLRASGDEKGFLERSECYLFVEETRMYLDNNFLKLANIIDTPGMGSITDRHDLITERHLRKTNGIIVIMIPINENIESYEFWNLLGLIHCIFTYEKRSTDRVFFICNWFNNYFGTNPDNGIQKVERIKTYLNKFGFTNPNLFVCDLRSYKAGKQDSNVFNGYPSVGMLISTLKQKIKEHGPGKNLAELQSKTEALLKTTYNEEKKTLSELHKKNTDIGYLTTKLKAQIRQIENVELDRNIYKSEKNKIDGLISNCWSILKDIRKKDDWPSAKTNIVELAKIINQHFESPAYLGHVRSKINDIKNTGHSHKDAVKLSPKAQPSFGACGEMSLNAIGSRISSAAESWPNQLGRFWKGLWNNIDKILDDIRDKVYTLFESEANQIKSNYKSAAKKAEEWFEEVKEESIAEINVKIMLLELADDEAIKKMEARVNYLENTVLPQWENLSKKISKTLNNE